MLDISRRYNQVKTRQRVAIMPPNFAIQQRPNPTELGFDLNNVLAWTAREAQFPLLIFYNGYSRWEALEPAFYVRPCIDRTIGEVS